VYRLKLASFNDSEFPTDVFWLWVNLCNIHSGNAFTSLFICLTLYNFMTKVRGFRNLYSSRNEAITTKNKIWTGRIEEMVGVINTNKMLVGKPEQRQPSRSPCVWQDIIKMSLKYSYFILDWVQVAQDIETLWTWRWNFVGGWGGVYERWETRKPTDSLTYWHVKVLRIWEEV
jgi:hypothetical protein